MVSGSSSPSLWLLPGLQPGSLFSRNEISQRAVFKSPDRFLVKTILACRSHRLRLRSASIARIVMATVEYPLAHTGQRTEQPSNSNNWGRSLRHGKTKSDRTWGNLGPATCLGQAIIPSVRHHSRSTNSDWPLDQGLFVWCGNDASAGHRHMGAAVLAWESGHENQPSLDCRGHPLYSVRRSRPQFLIEIEISELAAHGSS